MPIRAIFLDFYGTLVHEDDPIVSAICSEIAALTDDFDHKAVGALWSEHFTSLYKSAEGDTFSTQRELESLSLDRVAKHLNVQLRADIDAELFEYWKQPRGFEDAKPFLASLPEQIKTCVVSNIDTSDLGAAIQHHEFAFDFAVTSESARCYKPNAAIFQQALELMDADTSEVLHIGDSLSSDIAGAGALGIKTTWLNRGRKPLREGYSPDYR